MSEGAPTAKPADIVQAISTNIQEARDVMSQAARKITHLRSLLQAALPFVPADHPFRPGMQHEVDSL